MADGISRQKVPTLWSLPGNPGLYRFSIPDRRSRAAYSATELRRRKLHQLIARSLLLLMGIPSLGICSTMHYKFVPDNHLARIGPTRNITCQTKSLIKSLRTKQSKMCQCIVEFRDKRDGWICTFREMERLWKRVQSTLKILIIIHIIFLNFCFFLLLV